MNENNKSIINTLLAIDWVLLIAVLWGGEALLRLSQGSMTEHTERYFKAGHAHAGVLVGIGMIMVLTLNRTNLESTGMIATWGAWVIGVLMLSGGFFLHAYSGETGQSSIGTTITAIGGIILGIVAVWFAFQLFRAR